MIFLIGSRRLVLFLCELRRRLDCDGFQQILYLIFNINQRVHWRHLLRIVELLFLLLHFRSHNRLFFDLRWDRYCNLESLALTIIDFVQIASYVFSNQHISFVCSLVLVELLGNQNNELLFRVLRVLVQKLLHSLDTNSIVESPCIIFL